MDSRTNTNPLVGKIETHTRLAPEARHALAQLPWTVKTIEKGRDIARSSERSGATCLVLDGFACRYKLVGDAQRQIMSLHIRGDLVDLHGLMLQPLDHSIGAVTQCKVGMIADGHMNALLDAYPAVAKALWRDTLVDGAIHREWLTGMGRRSAYAGLARFLCEMMVRLKAVGLASGSDCAFPLTQNDLADTLGLSVVHVNRLLQSLRNADLITLKAGRLSIHDWDKLCAAGEFDPAYLHLERAA